MRCAVLPRNPVQVLVQTGIRLSECSGLTFGDITFGERSGLLLIRAGKGSKVRSVPLNASARDVLAVYVAPRLGVEKVSLKTVAAKWPKPPSPRSFEPLWLSQKGGALSTSAMGQIMWDLRSLVLVFKQNRAENQHIMADMWH